MTRIFQYKQNDSFMVAVDCIIFGFDGKEIKALLVKRGFEPEMGKWSLMGGFVKSSESVDAAANRILDQLTGLTSVYMEQLYCFGDVSRDPGGRVVSVAYFALIKIDDYSEELMKKHNAKWFSLNKIPSLVFDHKQMIKIAKSRLRQKVSRQPIGFALLPDKFTLQQLQALYEAIYETAFDKRNFTKKILSLGVLKKLKEKDKETSKKGSFYYVFIREKYTHFANENFKFI
ncbi:MAG TPA: NUDIX domain-containing protein [Chitinophagaceae bacterium]|nr:NUDIX domain-containing protein [Chitinophagaceae bacterium]